MNSGILSLVALGGAFAACAFFVIAGTLLRERNSSSEEIRRTHRPLKIALVVLAALAGGAFLYSAEGLKRVTAMTLFEAEVPGTVGVAPGEPAPVRELRFQVEHPGVEHELFISPRSNGEPEGSAEVAVRIVDGQSRVLLSDENTHAVRRSRRSAATWDSRTLPFTPSSRGPHRLLVTPLSVGIAQIFVRVEDPQKRDGKHMER